MINRVACIAAGDLQKAVADATAALDLDAAAFFKGRRVLIKPSFNSPDPSPASSDPAFLTAVVDWLREQGAAEIAVGDSCGLRWCPAAAVHEKLGIPAWAKAAGVGHINFDDGPWRKVAIQGRVFTEVEVAEAAFAADRVIYATCMKTHRKARFSLSLKHAVGFLAPALRRRIHAGDLEENVAEINLAVKPDLILMDGRRCFVSGGPAEGWVRRPGVILAGTDRVAVDVEALKILSSFLAFNRVRGNPWNQPQIRRAVELGLGARSERDYEVVKG